MICENYNECYHCAGVHPELCAVVPAFKERGGADLDWTRGVPHRAGAYTFTGSGTTGAAPSRGSTPMSRCVTRANSSTRTCSSASPAITPRSSSCSPRSAARTEIVCHFLFEPYELAKSDFDARDTTEFWDLVNRQDWAICEAVQQGISARVHERGYYAPMEDFNLDIRRYVLRAHRRRRRGGVSGAISLPAQRPPLRRPRVRWRLYWFLFGFGHDRLLPGARHHDRRACR